MCACVCVCVCVCVHDNSSSCVCDCASLRYRRRNIIRQKMHGFKLPCPIRAFLPSRSLWISELERYHWHANSVLLGARYRGACYCNICAWNGWWLWFLSVWQSAWAPSSEWQGLAVNANGREQLTEKRIIISLHYIYTPCLSVSLLSSRLCAWAAIGGGDALFTCFAEGKHLLWCRCIICSKSGMSGDNVSPRVDYTRRTRGLAGKS